MLNFSAQYSLPSFTQTHTQHVCVCVTLTCKHPHHVSEQQKLCDVVKGKHTRRKLHNTARLHLFRAASQTVAVMEGVLLFLLPHSLSPTDSIVVKWAWGRFMRSLTLRSMTDQWQVEVAFVLAVLVLECRVTDLTAYQASELSKVIGKFAKIWRIKWLTAITTLTGSETTPCRSLSNTHTHVWMSSSFHQAIEQRSRNRDCPSLQRQTSLLFWDGETKISVR